LSDLVEILDIWMWKQTKQEVAY